MSLRRITAPPVTPVTLAEAKDQCNIDATDTSRDTKLTAFIVAATALLDGIDGYLNRALVEQVWELVLDEFPTDAVYLLPAPLIAVVSVGYLDENGDAQTLTAGTDYTVDADLGWIVLPDGESWPTTYEGINAVTIRFRAGYASGSPIDGAAVPAPIKQAMLMLIAEWFDNREATATFNSAAAATAAGSGEATLPPTVRALLSPYRIWR